VEDPERFDRTRYLSLSLPRREGKTLLAVRKAEIQKPVSGNDHDALVSAQSLALPALSREIAGEISRLASGGTNPNKEGLHDWARLA
jgi:hypothetical protein